LWIDICRCIYTPVYFLAATNIRYMSNTERKRLEIVRKFEQLNFTNNKELNDMVSLAIEMFNCPIALITLMDEHIQWIKCKEGVDINMGKRENSFGDCLMGTTEVMAIPDTLLDAQFHDHEIVTGKMGIRFYAGMSLITSTGFHIGALCIGDRVPHEFSDKQKEMLKILSRQVINIMEMQISLKITAQHNIDLGIQKTKTLNSERKLRAFFNSSVSSHTLIGKKLEVIDFNKATAVFIKRLYHKQIKTGRSILNYINPSYRTEFLSYIKKAFTGKRTNKDILINDGEGSEWWNISFQPVMDARGNIISVANSATNINEHKQQVAEIISQNKSLADVAYTQSHVYRKPVASILGLIGLIKDDNYLPNKECVLMMERAVIELDAEIRNIVNFVEEKSVGNSAA
jgi:hypothetical protein